MLHLANQLLTKQKTVKQYTTLRTRGKHLLLLLLFAAPTMMIGQESDSTSTKVNSSPWSIDLSITATSLFGNAIKTLPGETKLGLGYDGAIKYQRGNIGLALSGGYWTSEYNAPANANQRRKNHSAHYVMFGPYYSLSNGKASFEINPKVGVQRFYFPHLRGTPRVRSDFDAGVSAGLGLKALFPVSDFWTIHGRLDYMKTLGDEAFKYTLRNGGQVTTNTDALQSLSLGLGASLSLNSKEQNDGSKSFAPTAIDIAGGAGLNFLIGKGIDNLPGEKSAGYDADLTLNYRIGRSGIALSGGFWDNKYEAKSSTEAGNATIRKPLDNISAHYISAGPIIPITSKSSTKMRLELVPHVGIQRIYFPHSRLTSATGNLIRRVTTNLEAGWSAGLGANLMIPIDPKLDLKIGADYTSMLTDRSFGFTVQGSNGYTNRKPLARINAGIGLAYNLMKKEVADDKEISPEEISDMINAKEDDMDDTDTDNKNGTDMQVGGEGDGTNNNNGDVDTTNETVPSTTAPTTPVPAPATTNPAVVTPSTTTPSVPTTTTPTTTTPATTTSPVYTSPSTPSPVYTDPAPTTSYSSDNSNTVYRVQFVALSKDVKVFNQLKQYGTVILEYYASKGLYRYMVGDASSKEEGMALLRRVHNNGWPKAFLVKYEDGQRTRIYE